MLGLRAFEVAAMGRTTEDTSGTVSMADAHDIKRSTRVLRSGAKLPFDRGSCVQR